MIISIKKNSARCKRNGVSEQLASSIYCLFRSLNAPRSAVATKRNWEKKTTQIWYDESEKLAVNIERVIRSLKNTWTVIKPPCQCFVKKRAKESRIFEWNDRKEKRSVQKLGRKKEKDWRSSKKEEDEVEQKKKR